MARQIFDLISGIPMVTLPLQLRQRFIDAWFDVLAPEGRMLQYTYSLVSPLPEPSSASRAAARASPC